jgi:hypothetical protein
LSFDRIVHTGKPAAYTVVIKSLGRVCRGQNSNYAFAVVENMTTNKHKFFLFSFSNSFFHAWPAPELLRPDWLGKANHT